MKERMTLTVEPTLVKRAKQLAHARKTSVSGLVSDLLRSAAFPSTPTRRNSFADTWGGRFTVKSDPQDVRLRELKKKHGL